MTIKPPFIELTHLCTCDYCGLDRPDCRPRADGLWLCTRCYWDGIPGHEDTRFRRAWEALERVLPLCGEWPRGAVLAADGKLLEWVLANDPGARGG
jgi:hypothetical protein